MNLTRYMMLLALVTLFALIAVAQRARVLYLETRIAQLEDRRARLSDDNRKLLVDIYALAYPARIADEVGRRNIELLDPVELTKTNADAQSGEQAGKR